MAESKRPHRRPHCRICEREIPAESLDFAFRIDRDDSNTWLCPECAFLVEPLIRRNPAEDRSSDTRR